MKKRNLAFVFVLLVALLVSQATAFASEVPPQNLRYNEVSAVEDYINYYNGTLYFGATVLVPDRDTLDYVIINAELRTLAGELIGNYNKRLAYSGGQFDYDRTYVPDHTGFYFLKYTLKCYKDGVIVDKISKCTNNEYVEIN